MQRWSKQENELFTKLHDEGKTLKEIASALSKSPDAVRGRFGRAKLHSLSKFKHFTWDAENEKLLIKMIADGENYWTLAEKLGTTYKVVYTKAQHLGLKTVLSQKFSEQKALAKKGLRKCYVCQNIHPNDSEHFSQNGHCVACVRKASKKQYKNKIKSLTVESLLRLKWLATMTKAKKKNIRFEITLEDILNLYRKQEGRCYYSDIPMEINIGKFNPSIDKVIPKKGYIRENVVLCCSIVNTMKLDSSRELFIELCRKISQKSS